MSRLEAGQNSMGSSWRRLCPAIKERVIESVARVSQPDMIWLPRDLMLFILRTVSCSVYHSVYYSRNSQCNVKGQLHISFVPVYWFVCLADFAVTPVVRLGRRITALHPARTVLRHLLHTVAMPPRFQLLSKAATAGSTKSYQPLAPFLYPVLNQQRSASILSSLSDTKGAYNKRIKRGRGPSSGKGKTSGRGHKGQKQHGKVPAGFNGGQTPDEVVSGSRGFENQYGFSDDTKW